MARLKKLKRALTLVSFIAARKSSRPPPINVEDIGDDWNSSDSEGWELSSESDASMSNDDFVSSSEDEGSEGEGSEEQSSDDQDTTVASISSIQSGESRIVSCSSCSTSMHVCTPHGTPGGSGGTPCTSPPPQHHKHRSHLFPQSPHHQESPRRFFYPKHMYRGLMHRIVIRIFDSFNLRLQSWYDDPCWVDLVTCFLPDDEPRVVLDLVEEHMGLDTELFCWALTCLHLTLLQGRLMCPCLSEYNAGDVVSVARQLLKMYAMPQRRKHETEDEADIAQTDLTTNWLLQALDAKGEPYYGQISV
jgi:hypothetical protein